MIGFLNNEVLKPENIQLKKLTLRQFTDLHLSEIALAEKTFIEFRRIFTELKNGINIPIRLIIKVLKGFIKGDCFYNYTEHESPN